MAQHQEQHQERSLSSQVKDIGSTSSDVTDSDGRPPVICSAVSDPAVVTSLVMLVADSNFGVVSSNKFDFASVCTSVMTVVSTLVDGKEGGEIGVFLEITSDEGDNSVLLSNEKVPVFIFTVIFSENEVASPVSCTKDVGVSPVVVIEDFMDLLVVSGTDVLMSSGTGTAVKVSSSFDALIIVVDISVSASDVPSLILVISLSVDPSIIVVVISTFAAVDALTLSVGVIEDAIVSVTSVVWTIGLVFSVFVGRDGTVTVFVLIALVTGYVTFTAVTFSKTDSVLVIRVILTEDSQSNGRHDHSDKGEDKKHTEEHSTGGATPETIP
ncbi:hypothetical protein MAR_012968 [Mya arenaria]|uniref:Uncharacterized protein n=1 Tax=Mya arenaria TaxID=6604 RepID=A0ABY7G1J5_MYAAR|nr:hypothetical protein MAR_012968 [Mya arenaria]